MTTHKNTSQSTLAGSIEANQQFSMSFEHEKIQRLSLSCNTIIEDDTSNEQDLTNRLGDYFSKYALNAKISTSKEEVEDLRREVRKIVRGYNKIKDTLIEMNEQLMTWEVVMQVHEQE